MAKRGGRRARTLANFGEWLAPPRFIAFLVLLPAAYFGYRVLVPGATWQDALAMAFDFAAAAFLASVIPLLRDDDIETIRRHARENDANRPILLLFTSLLTVVIMAALTGELGPVGSGDILATVKLVATLLLIWAFAQVVYALHYAHMFYTQPEAGGDCGGLEFPGTDAPNYTDFCYFSFTLGMTFQTSDVSVTSRAVRSITLLHSFAAFLFNIGVIAFTINTLGGAGG